MLLKDHEHSHWTTNYQTNLDVELIWRPGDLSSFWLHVYLYLHATQLGSFHYFVTRNILAVTEVLQTHSTIENPLICVICRQTTLWNLAKEEKFSGGGCFRVLLFWKKFFSKEYFQEFLKKLLIFLHSFIVLLHTAIMKIVPNYVNLYLIVLWRKN